MPIHPPTVGITELLSNESSPGVKIGQLRRSRISTTVSELAAGSQDRREQASVRQP